MNSKIVGWIGTGVMGKSMCRHIISKGHRVLVHNRTKAKTDDLVELGATFASFADVAKQADYVFLMLGVPKDVEEHVFEKDGGLINLMKPGSFLVDHTTSSPALAVRLTEAFKAKKIACFDAPVSGGDIGAKNGQLVTMCGGDKAYFSEVEEIMNCYSKKVQLMGDAGAGQNTKMANQIAIASCMVGVCESLIFSHKAGLDVEQVIQVIGGGAAGSFSLNAYAPRILKGDFAPGFFVEHFVKDMDIALKECENMSIKLPGLELARKLYGELMAMEGGPQMGTQALIKVLEKINNVTIG